MVETVRQSLVIHFHDVGSVYSINAPHPGIPRRSYGKVRLTEVVNLYSLADDDDVDHIGDFKPSSPRYDKDGPINGGDDDDDGYLNAAAASNSLALFSAPPPPPPGGAAKSNRSWLRYMARLAISAALFFFAATALASASLPAFQRHVTLAIPVHRPINNLLHAYNPLDLILFSDIKQDLYPERERHSLALVRRLKSITDLNFDFDADNSPPLQVCTAVLTRLVDAVDLLVNINATISPTAIHVYYLGQWLAEGILSLDAKVPPSSDYMDSPLAPSVTVFKTYALPCLTDPEPTRADFTLVDDPTKSSRVLSQRITSALKQDEDLRVALVAANAVPPLSMPPRDLRDDSQGEAETAAPLWNSSSLHGWTGSHNQLAIRLYDISLGCIATLCRFEDADEEWQDKEDKEDKEDREDEHRNDSGFMPPPITLLPPTLEPQRHGQDPAALVTAPWHKWILSSTTITLEPDAIELNQAMDCLESQLACCSRSRSPRAAHLRNIHAAFDLLVKVKAEKAGNEADAGSRKGHMGHSPWKFSIYHLLLCFFPRDSTATAETQKQSAPPEPIGVRISARPELAREWTSLWSGMYVPICLSFSAHCRQRIRDRDISIATLEGLLHEPEWQLYIRNIKENRKAKHWASTATSEVGRRHRMMDMFMELFLSTILPPSLGSFTCHANPLTTSKSAGQTNPDACKRRTAG
ncbi:hypothetical protein CORC01_00079 [Colletotrichum orchidophilum]|uniref:Uncharacterized protein n=1 Tax=Colletotrichum orchidophilum TaxID=1209926 RepID=A0A1G4BT93_9PEZI|nr:uncharacterized protein CORC01_00079 [Colletotrichum orchidophilum]OHF04608.1 hypothetical protein CORC01_00079 [Colletotrichum orchidophilum]